MRGGDEPLGTELRLVQRFGKQACEWCHGVRSERRWDDSERDACLLKDSAASCLSEPEASPVEASLMKLWKPLCDSALNVSRAA